MLGNPLSPRCFHLGSWWLSVLFAAVITGIAFHAMSMPLAGPSRSDHGWLLATAAFPFGIQALLITPSLLQEAEHHGVRRSVGLYWRLAIAGTSLIVVLVCVLSS